MLIGPDGRRRRMDGQLEFATLKFNFLYIFTSVPFLYSPGFNSPSRFSLST